MKNGRHFSSSQTRKGAARRRKMTVTTAAWANSAAEALSRGKVPARVQIHEEASSPAHAKPNNQPTTFFKQAARVTIMIGRNVATGLWFVVLMLVFLALGVSLVASSILVRIFNRLLHAFVDRADAWMDLHCPLTSSFFGASPAPQNGLSPGDGNVASLAPAVKDGNVTEAVLAIEDDQTREALMAGGEGQEIGEDLLFEESDFATACGYPVPDTRYQKYLNYFEEELGVNADTLLPATESQRV